MGRFGRVIHLLGLMGLALLGYLARKGLLHLAYLGLTLGFVAGFMIDASAREKSLTDNLAFGTFLGGLLAYLDMRYGITDLTRTKLGEGFILAAITLAIITLVGSLYDEVRVGRTVRISYLPTIAMILALVVLFHAVSVNTTVSYTRTSYPPGGVADVVRRYNSTYADNFEYTALPVVNGTKAATFVATIANSTLAYLNLFIYSVHNTTRIRHPGNLTIVITLSPAPAELPRDVGDLALRCIDSVNNVIHKILPASVDYNSTTGIANATFVLSSVDVYFANLAKYVLIHIDVHYVPTTSVSVSLSMKIVGERVLDKTTAYIALILEAIAAILAIPEDVSRRIRRSRRRKARTRR